MSHVMKTSRGRRRQRTRYQLRVKSTGRPRLSVFRSSLHIYAQVIDDARGVTLAAASSVEKDLKGGLKTGANVDAAKAGGELLAELALAAGVKQVAFDRGSYLCRAR